MLARLLFPTLLLALSLPAICIADDWPQWRGPSRDGISQETGLLHQWPQDGPPLTWQVTDVGDGYSTPSVVGERIYLLGNNGLEEEFVQARNVSDGELIWSTKVGKVGENNQPKYPAARSTPTIDGEYLYALGSNGDLVCLTTRDGKEVWKKNLKQDFGGKPGNWAYAESPLVDGEIVVCTPGGAEATIVALNKKTGEPVWTSPLKEADEAGYASIVIMNAGGKKQYVQFLENGVVGIDAATGTLLWRYDRTAEGSPANIPTPIVQDNLVYTASARGGGALIAIESAGDEFSIKEIYHSQKLPNSIGGAILHEGHLYGTNRQGLMCVDFKTGEILWQDRAIGAASVLYADGLLFLHGENGEVALVEASPESYHELGRFTPANSPDRGKSKAWAYPVLANGALYIRDDVALWRYHVAE